MRDGVAPESLLLRTHIALSQRESHSTARGPAASNPLIFSDLALHCEGLRAPYVFILLVVATLLPICCTPPEFRYEPVSDGNCGDRLQNGKETDKDCGGPQCGKCDLGLRCKGNTDCENGACFANKCQAEHCTNQEPDGGETDYNCGGTECPGCASNQKCLVNSDCRQNLCVDGQCVPTTCGNDEKDGPDKGGTETDVDCGGSACPPCGIGKRCDLGGDCVEGACKAAICVPMLCANGQLDEGEEGTDCGGTCAIACDSEVTCRDNIVSNFETDVDCGGPCVKCENDKHCIDASDCLSAYCLNTICEDNPCIEAGTCGGEGGGGAGGTSGAGGEAPVPTGGTETGGVDPGSGGTPPETGGSAPVDGGEGGASGGTPPMGGAATGGAATGGAATGGAATGGTPGELTRCTGCAKLTVPLASAAHKANFAIPLNGTTNFGSAVVTARVYRQTGSGGRIKLYVQHSGNPDFSQFIQTDSKALEDLKYRAWDTISFNVGAQAAQNFDKSIVARVGIQITGDTGTEWETTVVFVDSMTVSGAGAGPWTFDNVNSIGSNGSTGSIGILFLNTGDDPVANAQLGWLGGG
jgi:hypothetical protein